MVETRARAQRVSSLEFIYLVADGVYYWYIHVGVLWSCLVIRLGVTDSVQYHPRAL
jgi:hypothetical protein